MHVLIADDDRITLEGLQQYVDWDGLGLEVTACARDGREALEVLSNTDIDILITDIRMPYLSGFELVNAASSKGRFPATIIISGYDDYEYLRQAIKLHIILGYIFKPIQLDRLTNLLREAIIFRKKQLSNTQLPELIDSDQRRYTYKDVVVNLQNLEAIYYALTNGDLDSAQKLFMQNWSKIVNHNVSLNFAKRFAWEITISLTQMLAKGGIDLHDIVMGDDPLALISGLERKDEVFALLRDFLSDIHLYLQQRSQFCDSKVAYVQQALEERFQDPSLTLQQLSDELHVTANYLGILYKKECGESFVAELTARRIDYAKQLIVTTQWRIHKISVDCGFSDPKYFAATFRRATTLTPSEYRSRFYGSAPQFDRKRC